MSFYSSSITTRILDPILDVNNSRVEWRFNKNSIFLSNMRVAGISATGTPQNINVGAGVGELIESIHLYDNNYVLSQLLQFDKYAAFHNYAKGNSTNRDLEHFLLKNNLGYEKRELDDFLTPKNALLDTTNSANSYNTSISTTALGWLDVKRFLPMLQALMYLPTSVFKDMRLVIQFKSGVLTNQATNINPTLIVDEMTDPETQNKLLSGFKGGLFMEMEHDFVRINGKNPSVGEQTLEQSETKQLKGYDNKYVNRLLLVKTPTTTTAGQFSTQLNKLGSQLFFREQSNMRINGRNLEAGAGQDTPNKALGELVDTFGEVNCYLNANHLPQNANARDVLGVQPKATLGEQDYRSFLVAENVNELQFIFKRTAAHDTSVPTAEYKLNQAVDCNFFGEVRKVLQVAPDGTYQIAYA
jgi:hypothetical protein